MSCRSHTPRNRLSNICKVCFWAVVFPAVVTVSVFVFTGVLLGALLGAMSNRHRSGTERPSDPSNLTLDLSPGVTRNVSFASAFFCSELTLQATGSRGSGASVYLIRDTPPITHRNSFTRRIIISRRRSYHVTYIAPWEYRLYSGTSITTSLYMSHTPFTGSFSVSKSRSGDRPVFGSRAYFYRCRIGYSRQSSFRIGDEAYYYFVYRRNSAGTSCSYPYPTNNIPFELQLNISASWFVHSTAGLTNAPNCSATTGRQCSLHVPADSNYRALIVTDLPTNNTDLLENIRINLRCSSTRGWAYAVVVLVPLLLVVGVTITTVILLVLCCCWRKRRASRHTQTTTTEEAATTSGVQLQEMDPQGPQQAVIDQKDYKTTSDSQKVEQQHHVLTAAPPPSYKDSLDYPTQKPTLPPPYSKE